MVISPFQYTPLTLLDADNETLLPGVYIDIVEIWFGIANGQISLICDRIICLHIITVRYYSFTFY